MPTLVETIGNADVDAGSAPGKVVLRDLLKWGKTVGYLIGSAALVGGINAAIGYFQGPDFSAMSWDVFDTGIKVSGTQLGMMIANLLTYALELVVKDSRKA